MHIKNYNLGNYIVPDDTKGGVCLEIGANVGSFTKNTKTILVNFTTMNH